MGRLRRQARGCTEVDGLKSHYTQESANGKRQTQWGSQETGRHTQEQGGQVRTKSSKGDETTEWEHEEKSRIKFTFIVSPKWVRHYIKCFLGAVLFNVILRRRYDYHAQFTGKVIEEHNHVNNCSESHGSKQGSRNLNQGPVWSSASLNRRVESQKHRIKGTSKSSCHQTE